MRVKIESVHICVLALVISFGSKGSAFSQIILPTNLDHPTDLAMSYTHGNSRAVIDVYKVLQTINLGRAEPIKFRLFYPQAFGPVGAGGADHLNPASQVDVLKMKIQDEMGLSESLKDFSAHGHGYLPYAWIQDLGEPMWIKADDNQWKLSFLDFNPRNREITVEDWPIDLDSISNRDLPFENPNYLVKSLNQVFKFTSMSRLPKFLLLDRKRSSNQGGNFEVLPDGTPYVGNTAPEEMLDFIRKTTGLQPLILDVDFLTVGHVDEIFSFVPSKVKENQCGYALVAADPLWGAYIVKDQKVAKMGVEESYLGSLRHFLKPGAKLDLTIPSKLEQFDFKKKNRKYATGEFKEFPRMYDWLVQRSLDAKRRIEANIVKTELQANLPNI